MSDLIETGNAETGREPLIVIASNRGPYSFRKKEGRHIRHPAR